MPSFMKKGENDYAVWSTLIVYNIKKPNLLNVSYI
jgi:hypothetical protein